MAVRSNNYPSSEVKEIDLSTGAVTESGSMHLIVGFTGKGQLYTPTRVYTLGQYVNVFGEPLTDAEFYVYAAVSRVLANGGTPIVVRLPYDNDASKYYRGLALSIDPNGFTPAAIDTEIPPTSYRYEALEENLDWTAGGTATASGVPISQLYEREQEEPAVTGSVTVTSGDDSNLDGTYEYDESTGQWDRSDHIGYSFKFSEGEWQFITPTGGTTYKYEGDGSLQGYLSEIIGTFVWDSTGEATQATASITISMADSQTSSQASSESYVLTSDADFVTGKTYYEREQVLQPAAAMLKAAGAKGFTKFFEMTAQVQSVTNANLALIASNGDFSSVPGISSANFFIVDRNKSTCIDDDYRGGLFIVVFDPLRAMLVQRLLDTGVTATDNAMLTGSVGLVSGIYPVASGDPIDGWSVNLDGSLIEINDNVRSYAPDSLSRQIANLFPGFDSSIVNDSVEVDKTYSNYVGIAVCMAMKSDSAVAVNTPVVLESFVGSVAPVRNAATGVSEYIVDVVNNGSSYVSMYANRLNQTEESQTSVTGGSMKPLPVKAGADSLLFCGVGTGAPSKVVLTSFQYGSNDKVVNGATVGANLSTALGKVSDVDDVQVDVVVDAGLSSIAQFTSSVGGEYYQPDFDIDAANGKITGAPSISTWTAIVNLLDSFCSGTRRDCMALIDAPRNATLKGSSPIINPLDQSATFANDVEQGFTAVSSALNSSYSAVYANWTKRSNPYTGTDVWVPPSCEVAGACARCDVTFNPWNSPAFLERGVISGVAGLSLYPGKEEESFLYPKSLNYVKYFNAEGYVIWGQKTSQKKDGAFSRINVRRNALRIERYLYQVGRQFIGKGNTVYNRRQWIDLVTPYLSAIKNADGIYDFYLVCDETNNTPEVIDANEFRAAAFIKFVREGEFVVTSVVATNTGADFSEVVGVANI